jgi:hypothetical protein
MSEKTKTTKKNGSKGPSYIAYQVRDRGEGEKGFFTRIGAAWAHGDGNGFNIQLESMPRDGRVVLRTPSAKKE